MEMRDSWIGSAQEVIQPELATLFSLLCISDRAILTIEL